MIEFAVCQTETPMKIGCVIHVSTFPRFHVSTVYSSTTKGTEGPGSAGPAQRRTGVGPGLPCTFLFVMKVVSS